MKKLQLIWPMLFSFCVFGQETTQKDLLFEASWGGRKIHPDSTYTMDKGSVVQFEILKLYLSDIRFLPDDSKRDVSVTKVRLIDLSDSLSLKFKTGLLKNDIVTGVRFLLGIDSLVNVSGVYGGDLDPTKGMYWTWQSGYINFKIEGSIKDVNGRVRSFKWHIGGYQSPGNALQEIELKHNGIGTLKLVLDLEKFMKEADLNTKTNIMSPGVEAVKLAEVLALCFTIH
ncbi:MAG: hypothetical protein H6605_00365 [Flavobacteriales bacterium]|nr:hypothetical protein [Flavobacteriales bacterium]